MALGIGAPTVHAGGQHTQAACRLHVCGSN